MQLLPADADGDRYGRRRALLAGLAVFGVGSAAAALTTTAAGLIAMRTVMGAGAAFIMPATLSLLATLYTNSMSAAHLPPGPLGTASSQSIGAAAAISRHLPRPAASDILHIASHAYVHGADMGAWICAAAALAAAPIAFARLPRRSPQG